MEVLTPKAIVAALDKHIVGQADAKRAVAIAIRNRWRRQQLDADMKHEVSPKNILMIGSTGVGKTEIARRLAKLTGAPFIKVEATKYTEVGYYGRDVESMTRIRHGDIQSHATRRMISRRVSPCHRVDSAPAPHPRACMHACVLLNNSSDAVETSITPHVFHTYVDVYTYNAYMAHTMCEFMASCIVYGATGEWPAHSPHLLQLHQCV